VREFAYALVALCAVSSMLILDTGAANVLSAVSAGALPQNEAGPAYLPADMEEASAARHSDRALSTQQVRADAGHRDETLSGRQGEIDDRGC
jgi:hypothetical protein